MKENKEQVVKNLLKTTLTLEEIASVTGVALENVIRLKTFK